MVGPEEVCRAKFEEMDLVFQIFSPPWEFSLQVQGESRLQDAIPFRQVNSEGFVKHKLPKQSRKVTLNQKTRGGLNLKG